MDADEAVRCDDCEADNCDVRDCDCDCHVVERDAALFDADELGLDPEDDDERD